MSKYIGAKQDEIFVGNTTLVDWPREYLRGLKTLRLDEQALDLDGNKIDPAYMRPIFIGRSEADEYDRIMMRRTFPRQRW